jgi:hypothetical protein
MVLVIIGLLTHLAAAAPVVEMYEANTSFELPVQWKGVRTKFLLRVEKDATTRTGKGEVLPLIAVNPSGLRKIDIVYRPGKAANEVLEQFYIDKTLIIEGVLTIEQGNFVDCLRCVSVRKYVCFDKKLVMCDAEERVILEKGSKLTSVGHLKAANGVDLQKLTVTLLPLTEAEFGEAKRRPPRAIFVSTAPQK